MDIAAVTRLLAAPAVRLLTLTGVGGTGKTRLALAIAERVAPDFSGGVAFISLAPLREAAFVADPGHFGPGVVTFDAEIDPASATFGIAGGPNRGGDEFRVRPSATAPLEVNGHAPDVSNGNLLNPGAQPPGGGPPGA